MCEGTAPTFPSGASGGRTDHLGAFMARSDFDHILNWELKKGSHTFPGPEGGTCINEAAIVAAGFEYRSVGSVGDCPPCFSPVLATYALALNDAMPDYLRTKLLLPFVTRLAGTADIPAIEAQRKGFMALETIRRILPIALRATGFEAEAEACASASHLEMAAKAALAAEAAYWAAKAALAEIWTISCEILDGALRIGRQPDALDLELVGLRMQRARAGKPALALAGS